MACYIGNGVVLSAARRCCEEIDELEAAGVEVRSRLQDQRSLPADPAVPRRARHGARERANGGSARSAPPARGIGPAYEDKVARRAMRVQDLLQPRALRREAARDCSTTTTSC